MFTGDLSEAGEDWLDCYGGVRDIIETFGNVCDKATHIANRDLLYDLSPYITNINMLLHGWNSYLKWVAVHNCKKPLLGGPTLCGLPGGLAGDLMRLYPVQVVLYLIETSSSVSNRNLSRPGGGRVSVEGACDDREFGEESSSKTLESLILPSRRVAAVPKRHFYLIHSKPEPCISETTPSTNDPEPP